MPAKSKAGVQNRALSVRQPLAEKIMLGIKKIEYRSIPTNIRGRVYIYASKTPNLEGYKKMKKVPGDFPVGVKGGPGPGFFDLARNLGRLTSDDEQSFWEDERQAVYDTWNVKR